ncbi:MAG: glycosyltransferase, partial [Actinomycetota bacterium]|nr:glycosyltransferase [Actinomycetota bacterium]
MDVCTIIAKNYLAAARVLGASLHAQHPDARFHVLVVDDIDGHLDPSAEPFEILGPADIGLPGFGVMAGIYDVLELSTAVKPWLLRTLLERNGEGVVYLDPDMRVYAPLDEAFEAVREHGLVLSPHNTEPMPRDGRKPNEQDILIAGAYNLGFVGLAANGFSEFLLDWWAERLESDCIVDPARGFFVDQRWMDLVPGLARDFHLIRDPGFNVAYWNLAPRRLSRVDGRVLVNDVPLRLFHFSGFKSDRPHLLSTYQDRIRLGDDAVLAELCADYAGALEAAGHGTSVKWPYEYATTSGGILLDRSARGLYRRGIDDKRLDGTPFDAAGEREFVAYAHEPADVGGEHGVTRYLAELYARRPDLRASYPDLSDAGVAAGFLGWVDVHGREEVAMPSELLPDREPHVPSAQAQAASAPEEQETPPFGVNVAGYLRAELGVGEVARQVIDALDANACPVVPVGLSAPNSRQEHGFASVGTVAAPFDVNLICVNADGLPSFAAEAGEGFFRDRYSIGVWWWELAEFPAEMHGAFAHLDEVWAGSSFVADALSAVSPVPVVPMALPISAPRAALADRERLGVPEGFVFLFSFDYNSVFKRKNPLGLLEAFTRAFAPDDGVSLIVKSINHEKDPDNRDRLRVAASAHPHVHLMEAYLPAADKNALIVSCDAYVSLHRSEGFGLGLAEALLLGKPVIATGYGGNTDFVTGETGYVVPYELVDVGDDAWPYQSGARWADADLDRAGALMREVVADPAAAAARAQRGAALLLERHSP